MPSAPIRPGDRLITRIDPPRGTRAVAGWFAALGLAVALFAVLVAAQGAALVVVVAGPIAVGFLLGSVLLLRAADRPLALTTSQLIAPRLFRGWRAIDLTDVAGVGMHWSADEDGEGTWTLRVWPVEGPPVYIPTEQPDSVGLPGYRKRLRPITREEAPLKWQRVADSPAGRMATTITEQVLSVQGANGPFERTARQCTPPRSSHVLAYWSPDGRIGIFARGGP
jgi:hypothetical protein